MNLGVQSQLRSAERVLREVYDLPANDHEIGGSNDDLELRNEDSFPSGIIPDATVSVAHIFLKNVRDVIRRNLPQRSRWERVYSHCRFPVALERLAARCADQESTTDLPRRQLNFGNAVELRRHDAHACSGAELYEFESCNFSRASRSARHSSPIRQLLIAPLRSPMSKDNSCQKNSRQEQKSCSERNYAFHKSPRVQV